MIHTHHWELTDESKTNPEQEEAVADRSGLLHKRNAMFVPTSRLQSLITRKDKH